MKWFKFGKKKDSSPDDDHEVNHFSPDSNSSDRTDQQNSSDEQNDAQQDKAESKAPRHSKKPSHKEKKRARKQEKENKKKRKEKAGNPKKNVLDWSRHSVGKKSSASDDDAQLRQVRTRGLEDPNQGGKEEGNMQFIDDYEAADQDFNKYTEYQYSGLIKFPYVATKKERSNLYKAHVSIMDAKRLLLERLLVTVFLSIGFGLFVHVIFKKGFIISGLVTIAVALASWYALSNSIKKNYGNFKLNRQIAFNLFEKILAPNLHRVREGANLTNILEVVSKQIPQTMYRHYVDRLVVDMHMYPGAKEPFDNFAHTFSGGENSEYDALVFTNALYQLTQGKDSIDTINQLLKQSNRQLGQQQEKIMQAKQKPFKVVQYLLFATFFPFTIAYYGTTIMSYISSFHM